MKDRLTQQQLACLRKRDPAAADIAEEIFNQADACDARTLLILERLSIMDVELEKMKAAFPGGDYSMHLKYHSAMIKWMETRNELIGLCIKNAASVGVIAGMGWLLYAVFIAVKMEFMK